MGSLARWRHAAHAQVWVDEDDLVSRRALHLNVRKLHTGMPIIPPPVQHEQMLGLILIGWALTV